MEQYELAVLYHPDLEIDLEKATSKVEKQIAASEGNVVKTDNWGKRKMAYKIAKQEHAVYVIYTLELPTAGVKKLNDSLNITDEVIRFLITRPDLKKVAKAEALCEEKVAKQAARGEHAVKRGRVPDVCADELDVRAGGKFLDARQNRRLRVREVVDDAQAAALLGQRDAGMGADVAQSASDDNTHRTL